MSFIIAIDGPAGSGKGTVTKLVAKHLGITNIDTGAAYRCIALESIKENINIEEKEKIIKMLNNIDIKFTKKNGLEQVFLNGENVTDKIRQKDVTNIVSQISSIKEVRFKLNDIFRKMALNQDIIMEGRDIGTYVFPNANLKIYLDATPEERAKRRHKQNEQKGIKMSYEEIVENIKLRDKIDMEKEMGALKRAPDAIYIDSTNLSIEQVVKKIIEEVKKLDL